MAYVIIDDKKKVGKMTRPEKLSELLDLALELQNSYCGLTYDELCEKYGYPRRRIERMMSVISEKFGEKLEEVENPTDRKKHFRFKKGSIFFWNQFSESDFVLLDLLKNSINNKAIQNQVDELTKKIKAINPKGSTSLETDIAGLLETQGYAVRQYLQENIEPKIYEIIKIALLEQKKLRFDYAFSNGEKHKITVHPYGIQFWEKNYLVAYSEYDNCVLKYRISKIENLEKLDEYFERDENFDLKKYSEQSFGIYSAEPINVELLFNAEVREDVLNYHFHPTQKFDERKDGSVKVSFTASGEYEICYNLFKWSNFVKILKPLKLKEFYQKELSNILKNL